jgi:hypothetical protein
MRVNAVSIKKYNCRFYKKTAGLYDVVCLAYNKVIISQKYTVNSITSEFFNGVQDIYLVSVLIHKSVLLVSLFFSKSGRKNAINLNSLKSIIIL